MTELIKAVEPMAALSGRGLDVVSAMPAAGPAARKSEAAADDRAVRDAVADLGEQLREAGVDLSYRVDRELNRVIVEVIDRKDGTVLRQIPGEEVLRLARLMKSGQGGLLQAIA